MTQRPTIELREIAFVDPNIPDRASLLAGLRPEVEAIVLDASKPALAEIAATLESRGSFDVVHIVAHGAPGEVSFAGGALTRGSLNDHGADLFAIGRSLEGGDLLLWRCN